MLNHYKMNITLPSPFHGQDTEATFELDFHNTDAPSIGNGFIDFSILGEVLYIPKYGGKHHSKAHVCKLEPDLLSFTNSMTFSQLVISESAATCMMNSFASSELGQVYLTSSDLNAMF